MTAANRGSAYAAPLSPHHQLLTSADPTDCQKHRHVKRLQRVLRQPGRSTSASPSHAGPKFLLCTDCLRDAETAKLLPCAHLLGVAKNATYVPPVPPAHQAGTGVLPAGASRKYTCTCLPAIPADSCRFASASYAMFNAGRFQSAQKAQHEKHCPKNSHMPCGSPAPSPEAPFHPRARHSHSASRAFKASPSTTHEHSRAHTS